MRAANDPVFKLHKHYVVLEQMLEKNKHEGAELLNASKKIISLISPQAATPKYTHRITQSNIIDGEIIGIAQSKSIDKTVNTVKTIDITMRSHSGQIFGFIADLAVSFELNKHLLRGNFLRLQTNGIWLRTKNNGWIPESKHCKIIGFEALNNIDDAHSILTELRNSPNNGLAGLLNIDKAWREMRGAD